MSPKTQMATRYESDQIEALAAMSDADKCAISDSVRGLIPTGFMLEAHLRRRSLNMAASVPDSIRELVARGMAAEMIEAGVDQHDTLGRDPEGMAQHWMRWQHATAARAGLIDDPDYRLETPPRGGRWEAEGVNGMLVVAAGVRLTPDGWEQVIEGRGR